MVLQKRLEYGFSGYQVPTIPRASRSARGKRLFRKKAEDQVCAFDLLAAVAGELLLSNKSALPPSSEPTGRAQLVTANEAIRQEEQHEEKLFKCGPCVQGSSDESTSATNVVIPYMCNSDADYVTCHDKDAVNLPSMSLKAKFDSLERVACADQPVSERNKGDPAYGECHDEIVSSGFSEFSDGKLEEQTERQLGIEQQRTGCTVHGFKPDMHNLNDAMDLDVKPPACISSDSSIEAPLCGDHMSSGLYPRCQDDFKVVNRDDDENFSEWTQPRAIPLKACRPPQLGDRKIKKMLVSKFWKVAPVLPRDGELSNNDRDRKSDSHNGEPCCTRRRTQRSFLYRKRSFERSSISTSEGGISSEDASNSPVKDNKESVSLGTKEHGAIKALSPAAGQEQFSKSEVSLVKLRIKSFRVPELFIEIPETATVGSLKRTVVEAASAIVGGGLQISVLLQGKKVRDDDRTLLQSGISHKNKLDTLGFMLEPDSTHAPLCREDCSHLLQPCDKSQPTNGYSVVPSPDPVVPVVLPNPPLANAGNGNKNDYLVTHAIDNSSEKSSPNSKALVSIPAMKMEALAVMPLPRKSRQPELVQRRTRRPFSVSEVEALVQAVEKLGTGRWRDVKLRAFENAKHRTYVDLKDKWKTLVHTARISPQQRRGEPVPQELLDRVLSAHAYWSQQQMKHHCKPRSEPCLLF